MICKHQIPLRHVNRFPAGIFAFSLLLAILVHVYPVRGDLAFWRPPLPLLVMLYWMWCEPFRSGVGLSWCIGLGLDLMFGPVLGLQALAMAACAYVVKILGQRLQHFSLPQHSVLVVLVVVVYQVVVATVAALLGRGDLGWALFYPALSSALVWPLLVLVLHYLRRHP